jgi:hypothetical protein
MKGLSKEARLSAIRQLRVALAKKMKHEMSESPAMQAKEDGVAAMDEGPRVSIHVSTGKEINKGIDKIEREEAADPKDKPINDELRASLKKFMHDDLTIKPKGSARVVYGGPKIPIPKGNEMLAMVEKAVMPPKKPGRPKRS